MVFQMKGCSLYELGLSVNTSFYEHKKVQGGVGAKLD